MSRNMTKPTKWVCAQRRLRSAWASAQSDQSLRCPHEETFGPWLPIERTAKTLIRLGGCPGWSESSLGAHSFCTFCHVVAHIIIFIHFLISITINIINITPITWYLHNIHIIIVVVTLNRASSLFFFSVSFFISILWKYDVCLFIGLRRPHFPIYHLYFFFIENYNGKESFVVSSDSCFH